MADGDCYKVSFEIQADGDVWFWVPTVPAVVGLAAGELQAAAKTETTRAEAARAFRRVGVVMPARVTAQGARSPSCLWATPVAG